MPVPDADIIREDAAQYLTDTARGREGRFRIDVVITAYQHTCALTGYRLTTVDMEDIVDAAHIHQFSDSRNNHPSNGLALCKNAHWQFDRGLWSLTDDFRVLLRPDLFTDPGAANSAWAQWLAARSACPNGGSIGPTPCIWRGIGGTTIFKLPRRRVTASRGDRVISLPVELF